MHLNCHSILELHFGFVGLKKVVDFLKLHFCLLYNRVIFLKLIMEIGMGILLDNIYYVSNLCYKT